MKKNVVILKKQEMKKVVGGGYTGPGGPITGSECWTSCIQDNGGTVVFFEDPQLSVTSCHPNVAFRTCNGVINNTEAIYCWCHDPE